MKKQWIFHVNLKWSAANVLHSGFCCKFTDFFAVYTAYGGENVVNVVMWLCVVCMNGELSESMFNDLRETTFDEV